ncbi:lysoplasmalogenase [Desertimonas flava]|uniref:lysoplasmalogenase n=1 Tax=Desertimonas flava TaxID=2064846 RepID=UPI0013C3F23B|nr:lysoplasmalogenase [Desertimonas flava]
MNPVEVGLVAAFAICAVANWIAVAPGRDDRRQVAVTKTAATVVLIAIAALAGDMESGARTALVVAVVLCLVGDVALLGDTEERFIAGLGSFALGHIAYVVTSLMVGVEWPRLAIAFPFLALLFGFRFVGQTIPGARADGGPILMGAVTFYALVIATMVTTATGTPVWAAAAGAMLFAVSDWMIGYDRFVQPFRWSRVGVMSTYHMGQLLLIAGLIAGG